MQYRQNLSEKAGLPPGSLIYVGDLDPQETDISLVGYGKGEMYERSSVTLSDIKEIIGRYEVIWIRISGLKDIEGIQRICEIFDLHPLVIEDIFNTKTRTKFEDFGEYLFITLDKVILEKDQFVDEQMSIIMLQNVIITIHERVASFSHILGRIRHETSKFQTSSTDYLSYALIDYLVDTFFTVLENLDLRLGSLEDEIISKPSPQIMAELQAIRRDMVWFRRRVWSVRDVIIRVERTDSFLIHDNVRVFYRDIYDHVLKISEDMDMNREMVESLMEIYLSSISNSTNQVMKVLTLIATVFIPLTFITSFYGMNFEYMYELRSPVGYPVVLLIMVIIGILELVYFKKKGWL